jgi:hypothetical protein
MRQSIFVRWPSIAGLVLFFAGATNSAEVTIDQLCANLKQFHKQTITIRGGIADVRKVTSRNRNAYTTAQLKEKCMCALTVFSWGHCDLKGGDSVEVTGIFWEERRVSSQTFFCEIDAKSINKIDGPNLSPIACR